MGQTTRHIVEIELDWGDEAPENAQKMLADALRAFRKAALVSDGEKHEATVAQVFHNDEPETDNDLSDEDLAETTLLGSFLVVHEPDQTLAETKASVERYLSDASMWVADESEFCGSLG